MLFCFVCKRVRQKRFTEVHACTQRDSKAKSISLKRHAYEHNKKFEIVIQIYCYLNILYCKL